MEVEQITPKILKSYLHVYRTGARKPWDLLELHAIEFQADAGRQEKHLQLFVWLENLTLENLNYHRQNRRTMQTSNLSWRYALRRDFQNSNTTLQAWSALYYRYFFSEAQSFDDLAEVAGYDPRQFRRRLDAGLNELCELIQRKEMEAHQRNQKASIGGTLPDPEYGKLFGISAAKEQLQNWLLAPNDPCMLSIEGIGGIGKTALARALLNDILEKESRFHDILWISARQEILTLRGEIEKTAHSAQTLQEIASELARGLGLSNLAGLETTEKLKGIQPLLSLHPHLIVIDNLETAQEVKAIVPALRKIAGQSCFLFTSRRTLAAFPYVHIFSVPELSAEDSRRLVEAEVIRRRGEIYSLNTENAKLIYETVGGLPLALKLIAAQISDLSEEYTLRHLSQISPGKSVRALYTYIYKQTWKSLSEASKHLLLSMLLVSQSGDSIDWIQKNSGLSVDEFEDGFKQLLEFSLIEINQNPTTHGFYLHRLTQSFLKKNILQEWEM